MDLTVDGGKQSFLKKMTYACPDILRDWVAVKLEDNFLFTFCPIKSILIHTTNVHSDRHNRGLTSRNSAE